MLDKNLETIHDMQNVVKKIVTKYDLEIKPELRYVDLVSEVGEVGKELLKGTDYGKNEFYKTSDLDLEIGDTLFSLICIANSLNIDLNRVLKEVINKYDKRFAENGNIGSGR